VYLFVIIFRIFFTFHPQFIQQCIVSSYYLTLSYRQTHPQQSIFELPCDALPQQACLEHQNQTALYLGAFYFSHHIHTKQPLANTTRTTELHFTQHNDN